MRAALQVGSVRIGSVAGDLAVNLTSVNPVASRSRRSRRRAAALMRGFEALSIAAIGEIFAVFSALRSARERSEQRSKG